MPNPGEVLDYRPRARQLSWSYFWRKRFERNFKCNWHSGSILRAIGELEITSDTTPCRLKRWLQTGIRRLPHEGARVRQVRSKSPRVHNFDIRTPFDVQRSHRMHHWCQALFLTTGEPYETCQPDSLPNRSKDDEIWKNTYAQNGWRAGYCARTDGKGCVGCILLKKDGTFRFYFDHRNLETSTKCYSYPTSHMNKWICSLG